MKNIQNLNNENVFYHSIQKYKQWLKRKNFADETISRYLITINKFKEKELNTDSIIDFLRENLEKHQPNTLKGQKNALASYAKFFEIHDKIEWDIVNKIIPRIQKRPFPTLIHEEFLLLKETDTCLDKLTNERNNLILDFFWYIGMRVNELINIRHSDYRNKLLWIKGKGNKVRHVFLPEFLIKHFDSCSREYLFLTRNGKKLTKGQINRNIKKKVKKANIKKNISSHSFRRSLATNSYNLGVKLDTIQKQLGHSDLNTTMGYIHNDYDALYNDYSKLWTQYII